MPKNKTGSYTRLKVALTAREAHQIRFHTKTDNQVAPACVCSAHTILAAMKLDSPLLCSDMPWRCPLNDNQQKALTPTV